MQQAPHRSPAPLVAAVPGLVADRPVGREQTHPDGPSVTLDHLDHVRVSSGRASIPLGQQAHVMGRHQDCHVLRRLLDPETSTRRTSTARERLAAHPMTTELLEAGLRLLEAELTPPEGLVEGPGTARFFTCLSAARVCEAATRHGPLRVTAAHLRDRWPRSEDYVADLLAYALWREHQFAAQYAAWDAGAQMPPGLTLADVADGIASSTLYMRAVPVPSRVEVFTSALAASNPRLRDLQRRAYADSDAHASRTLATLLPSVGLRPRAGRSTADLVRAWIDLSQGVNVRATALGHSDQACEEAQRTYAFGVQLLARWFAEPADTTGPSAPAGPVVSFGGPPPAHRSDPADVLLRLVGADTGTRRTEASRRRLANDGITSQLLAGGMAVLGEEFGVAATSEEPRFFASLSGARVVAEARAVGAAATTAQLRDRWPLHEHYVDDLVDFALERTAYSVARAARSGAAVELPGADAVARTAFERDAMHARLADADGSPDLRLRLLLTTMGQRPRVAEGFASQGDDHARAVRAHLDGVLEAQGGTLADDVDVGLLVRSLAAVALGEILRVMATGDDDVRDGEPAMARCTTALLGACLA